MSNELSSTILPLIIHLKTDVDNRIVCLFVFNTKRTISLKLVFIIFKPNTGLI